MIVDRQPRELEDAPRDTWLVASAVLTALDIQEAEEDGRPVADRPPVLVPVGKRYPHTCHVTVPAARTSTKVTDIERWMRDCAHPACVKAYAEYQKRKRLGQ